MINFRERIFKMRMQQMETSNWFVASSKSERVSLSIILISFHNKKQYLPESIFYF